MGEGMDYQESQDLYYTFSWFCDVPLGPEVINSACGSSIALHFANQGSFDKFAMNFKTQDCKLI